MKGRKPQHLSMRHITGNLDRRANESTDGDPFIREKPIKPHWLNEREGAEWDRLSATLSPILSRSSEGMMVVAVQAFNQMMAADEIIAKYGFTYVTTTKEGSEMIRQRPEVGIRDRARRQYQQALQELAAGPVSATRVRRLPERKTEKQRKAGTAKFFTS